MTLETQEKWQECYDLLLKLTPDFIKPMAEMFLPQALRQMSDRDRDVLVEKLRGIGDNPTEQDAMSLIAYAREMGADESMIPPELAGVFGTTQDTV